MDLENTKKIINNSTFSDSNKQRLLVVLPSLGGNALSGLEKEVSRGDSVLIAGVITELWEKFASIYTGFKVNPEKAKNDFWELFNQYNELLNDEDKNLFLYFLIDVRVLSARNKNLFNGSEYFKIIDYEIYLFNFLPKEEILFLLGNHLLLLSNRWDVFLAVELAFVDNQWDYEPDFFRQCSDSISKDGEIFGKVKPMPIGKWVKEFTDSNPTALSKRGTYGITDFLIKNPLAISLSVDEKNILVSILKLFLWFIKPEVNEEEVDEYRKEIEAKKAVYYNKLYELYELENQPNVSTKPPVTPVPRNAPSLRPMGDVGEVRQNPNFKFQISNGDIGKEGIKENNSTSKSPPIPNANAGLSAFPKKPISPLPQIRPGLSMSMPENYQMPKKENLSGSIQANIDKKLEELEKRVEE